MARAVEKADVADWLHKIREDHYRETRHLPLERWLKPSDPERAAEACRRLGLRVRVCGSRVVKPRKGAIGGR